MATEVDPARGNQDGPNVDPAYGNQDEPNTALGVSSNPATGPPQSDISTPIASSQGDTLGSESTSPKIDPTEISAVTSASTGLTSRGDEVPTKEQKPDGPTVVSVANDNCATDDNVTSLLRIPKLISPNLVLTSFHYLPKLRKIRLPTQETNVLNLRHYPKVPKFLQSRFGVPH